MRYNTPKKKRNLSERENVINEMISATRKTIIAAELEHEFLSMGFAKIPEPQDATEAEAYTKLEERIRVIEATINVSIEKLTFLKQKRTDYYTKKAMKDYNAYPQIIKESDLYQDPRNCVIENK